MSKWKEKTVKLESARLVMFEGPGSEWVCVLRGTRKGIGKRANGTRRAEGGARVIEPALKRSRRRKGRRDFGTIKSEGTPTDPRFSVRWYEGGKQRRKRGFGSRSAAAEFLARTHVQLADGIREPGGA